MVGEKEKENEVIDVRNNFKHFPIHWCNRFAKNYEQSVSKETYCP
jgi:hypothetical protein